MITRNCGFTLIELIVTLLILSIVSLLAFPSLMTLRNSQDLRASSENLRTIFTEARGKAVLERRNIKVYLALNKDNTETELNWMPTGKSVLKSGPNTVEFQFNGTIAGNTDVSFVICDDATNSIKSKKLGLSRMGVVQAITEGDCDE